MNNLFYTYILHCSDDSYYVGVTNNIIRRVNEHNSENFPRSYCYLRRPVNLVYIRIFHYIEQAIAFEKQLKRWSRAKKQALIYQDFKKLHGLAACKNKTASNLYNNPNKSNTPQ
ncbi:MAG: GIY-YIG nuclease family protein [Bacteroidota bacterium]|nr:GIY-YIG nuclease family protein [Bacteroidota bacterium]